MKYFKVLLIIAALVVFSASSFAGMDFVFEDANGDTLDTYCMQFPYAVQQEENWSTGLAVTNLGFKQVPPSEMAYSIVIVDANGDEFELSYDTGLNITETYIIDDLIDNNELDVDDGPIWIYVYGNFPVDGYMFFFNMNTDGMFGAGLKPTLNYKWKLDNKEISQ